VGRRLGQHFLFDPSILDRIVDALDPTPDDHVIEIGPGRGTLTERLVGRVGRVTAIEADRALAARLRENPPASSGLEIIEGDALEVDWPAMAGPGQVFKVVGNIPYYITAPLIEKALAPPAAAVTVYLVQREVADRLVATPGTKAFGALTVGVRAVATVERVFGVPAGAFRPPPKVHSAVIRLRPLPHPLIAEAERHAFRRFVQALFSRRRKQVGGILRVVWGLGPDAVAERLHGLAVDPTVRPEALDVSALVAVFRAGAADVVGRHGAQVDSDP
jgi:16S rRNA (adenine1518-N6/adenine1519-N6)-dimethyltransferase